MSTPSIALVTPSYNQRRFLQATLTSVLDQDYPKLAYAVVDGASTDGSADVVQNFADRVSWSVSEKDAGQYDAINKGFHHVEGEIMGWLNSDDLHCPWTLAVVGDVFAQFPEVNWITTRFPLRWDARGIATNCMDTRGYALAGMMRGEYCGGGTGFFAAPIQQESTFWRRKLWERAGAEISTEFGSAGDFELWCRFAKLAELHAVNVPLAGFRQHGDQQTINAREEYFRQAQSALKHHFPRHGQGSIYRRMRPFVRDRFPTFCYPLARQAGWLHEAPVISRNRDNLTWRLDRVPV